VERANKYTKTTNKIGKPTIKKVKSANKIGGTANKAINFQKLNGKAWISKTIN
jgi:hypothetical protein